MVKHISKVRLAFYIIIYKEEAGGVKSPLLSIEQSLGRKEERF